MQRNYRMKMTVSVKGFIKDLGEKFSEHMKKRLLELEVRCVLTRKDDKYRLDLKHVEHTQYDCNLRERLSTSQKKYVYA